jgi:hypothetical protein
MESRYDREGSTARVPAMWTTGPLVRMQARERVGRSVGSVHVTVCAWYRRTSREAPKKVERDDRRSRCQGTRRPTHPRGYLRSPWRARGQVAVALSLSGARNDPTLRAQEGGLPTWNAHRSRVARRNTQGAEAASQGAELVGSARPAVRWLAAVAVDTLDEARGAPCRQPLHVAWQSRNCCVQVARCSRRACQADGRSDPDFSPACLVLEQSGPAQPSPARPRLASPRPLRPCARR